MLFCYGIPLRFNGEFMENNNNNKKNLPENNNDDKIKVGEQSVFDTLREQRKQRKHEQLEFESQMTRQIAEEKQKQRQEYEKKLQQEKIELLRMKQNNSSESDIIPTEESEEAVERTLGQKISSFFYLNKWWLGLFLMFGLIAGFLIYDYVTKKNPDTVILFFEDNDDIDKLALRDYIEPFCEDFNGDGKIIPDVYYIPYTGDEQKDYSSGTSTKLMAEMQSAEAMIVICNEKSNEAISPEYTLVNLETIYPDNPHVKKYGFYLKDSKFAEKVGYTGIIDDDVYLGIRKPAEMAWASEKEMRKAYDEAVIVFDRMIQDLT